MRAEFWWGDLREEVHLEYLGIDGRIILKWGFKKRVGWVGVHWINSLAMEQDI